MIYSLHCRDCLCKCRKWTPELFLLNVWPRLLDGKETKLVNSKIYRNWTEHCLTCLKEHWKILHMIHSSSNCIGEILTIWSSVKNVEFKEIEKSTIWIFPFKLEISQVLKKVWNSILNWRRWKECGVTTVLKAQTPSKEFVSPTFRQFLPSVCHALK